MPGRAQLADGRYGSVAKCPSMLEFSHEMYEKPILHVLSTRGVGNAAAL